MKIVALDGPEKAADNRLVSLSLDTDRAYEALFEIGTQIQAEEVNLDGVLQLIVDKATELVDSDVAWLALVTSDELVLNVVATSGSQHEAFANMSLEVGRGVGGDALARRETLVVTDYHHYLQDTPDEVRLAVTEEGIRSVVCAPMVRENRMVGALYVGNRTPTNYQSDVAALVTALAGQASIAIDNSRLLDQLEAKNRLLQQSEQIHRRLTDLVLQQSGIDGVAQTLAELLRRPLAVTQDIIPPFTRVFGDWPDFTDCVPGIRQPIVAGHDQLGFVDVGGPGPLDELGTRCLEHGVTVLAVELLRERSARDIEWRLGGELLKELLDRSTPVDRRLASRAERFGMDLGGEHRIVVLEALHGELDRPGVRVVATQAVVPGRRAWLVTEFGASRLVLALPATMDDQLEAILPALAAAATPDGVCSVGVSRAGSDLRGALREALACARFAGLAGRDQAIVMADDLGAMRFLLRLEDPAPLADYINEQLGDFLEDGNARESQLIETLRAFLELDGHHASIAERCHIHKSTVKYRLARIAELTGRSLNDPETKFELRLAFAMADVLTLLELAPRLEEAALLGARLDLGRANSAAN